MIDKGKKVFDGEIAALKRNFGNVRTFAFELVNAADFGKLDYRMQYRLSDDDITVERDKNSVTIKFNADKVNIEDIIAYTLSKVHITDMQVKDVDIEDIIKRLYLKGVDV